MNFARHTHTRTAKNKAIMSATARGLRPESETICPVCLCCALIGRRECGGKEKRGMEGAVRRVQGEKRDEGWNRRGVGGDRVAKK